jgi:predicted O-linked N-acetylglucosamine transferase (SPINDLY family)
MVSSHSSAPREVPRMPSVNRTDPPLIGALNQYYKVDATLLDAWCRAMRDSRSNATLCFVNYTLYADAARTIVREVARRGVGTDRIEFLPELPPAQHVQRAAGMAVCVDTGPVRASGHTSTVDLLWAGVPVLAISGERSVSRVAASLLHSVGLGFLSLSTLEEYEQTLALLLAKPLRLQRVRGWLGSRVMRSPLFDTAGWIRSMERAFSATHELLAASVARRRYHIVLRSPPTVPVGAGPGT